MAAERDFFLENLNLLLKAQMPVREALISLKQEIKTKSMKKSISVVETEIENGSSLSSSLDKSGLLSKRFISLLKIGEETGQFSEQLSLIIAEQKKEKSFNSKIKSALIYPGFVLVITAIVSFITIWYIFPKLQSVFQNIGGTLPLTTRIIIAVGDFFSKYGLLAVVGLSLAVIAGFYILFVNSKTKVIGEKILTTIPLSHTIIQHIELARFGYIMATLTKAGISLPEALDSVRDSTSFIIYKRFYQKIIVNMLEGNSLYKSITLIKKYDNFIPPHIAQLLLAGEQSGALSETLFTVSETYESKIDVLTKNISALIEPAIVVVVGLVVAVIAFSIISPIYNLVDQIGQ